MLTFNNIKYFKDLLIFIIFGVMYVGIELIYRGYSHYSMFILGGLCGLLIGLINEYTPKMNIILQMLLGTMIITILEFITGCIVNLWLRLNVWDYSNLKFNILGQVSLVFSFTWFILSYFVIKLDDYIRNKLKGGDIMAKCGGKGSKGGKKGGKKKR